MASNINRTTPVLCSGYPPRQAVRRALTIVHAVLLLTAVAPCAATPEQRTRSSIPSSTSTSSPHTRAAGAAGAGTPATSYSSYSSEPEQSQLSRAGTSQQRALQHSSLVTLVPLQPSQHAGHDHAHAARDTSHAGAASLASLASLAARAARRRLQQSHAHALPCPLVPDMGEHSCGSGPPNGCTLEANIKELKLRGVKLPRIQEFYSANCTHLTAGCKQDGVGSQLQSKLSLLAYTRAKGKTYVHFPFARSIGHVGSGDEERAMVVKMEDFFNVGMGEMSLQQAAEENILVCAVLECHSYFDNNGGEDCYEKVRGELLRKYWHSPKPPSLFNNASSLQVVIHIRRGDVSHMEGKAHHEQRRSPDEYFIDTLSAIKRALPEDLKRRMEVLIVSEGSEDDFKSIKQSHPDVRLALGADLLRTMHACITADILVLSHSSFSQVMGIYNSGVVVYSPFWHAPLPTWLRNPWPPSHNERSLNGGAAHPCSRLVRRLSQLSTTTFLYNRISQRVGTTILSPGAGEGSGGAAAAHGNGRLAQALRTKV